MSYPIQKKSALKKAALGILFSALASEALAWSISGNVQSDQGAPLAGVSISSFNYAGITGSSDELGNFSLSSDGSVSIGSFGIAKANFSVAYSGNVLQIANNREQTFKVSLMDALGKVTYQNEFASQNVSIDLSKVTHSKTMILRISTSGSAENYIVSKNGAVKSGLKKEGDVLAVLMFSKDGYKSATYTMASDIETDVKITLATASAQSSSSNATLVSSSSVAPAISSSSVAVSSSSTPEVTSCTGKTLTTDQTLTIDGRSVIIKFPSGYDGTKPAPLVVNYHPIGGSANNWSSGSNLAKVALADGAIVIFPDGAQSPNFGQAWNIGPCCTDADDITFTQDFLKEIEDKSCVDTKRIYAAGFSMGGGMSNYVGCKMTDVFAAAAPSAMDLSEELVTQGNYGGCHPSRPFPILNFRGTNDNVVTYAGAYSNLVTGKAMTFLGAKKNLATWAELNGCTGTAKSDTPYSGCEMYESCNGGVKTGLCTIQGGGHSEGDGQQGWDFLKQWKLP